MKSLLTLLTVFCLLSISNSLSHSAVGIVDNEIINGDFSFSDVLRRIEDGRAGGWKGTPTLEIGPGQAYNLAWNGGYVISLDTLPNTVVSQKIYGLNENQTCVLTYLWAVERAAPLQTAPFFVIWNGNRVLYTTPNDYDLHEQRSQLSAKNDRNTLSFVGAGKSDGLGATIGNIRLVCS